MYKSVVYCAHSHFTKHLSPMIAQFVIMKGRVPIDPFLVLPSDSLDALKYDGETRLVLDLSLLDVCDELWIFGQTGNYTPGVQIEHDTWLCNKVTAVVHVSFEQVFACVMEHKDKMIEEFKKKER